MLGSRLDWNDFDYNNPQLLLNPASLDMDKAISKDGNRILWIEDVPYFTRFLSSPTMPKGSHQ